MAIGGGGSGGGGRASDIKAGGAFFEIYAKDGLSGVIDKLKHKAEAFGKSMRHIGGLLFGGGLALGAAPFASLLEGVEKLSSIQELTEVFGITAEAASKMSYAFNVAGVASEDLEKVFKELAKTNTTGKPLDEYLLNVADGLLAIEDPSQRAQQAIKLLGRQGLNFLHVAKELRDLNKEAPLYTQEDLENAKKISMEWNKIKVAFSGAMVPLFTYLAPIIKLVAEFARENASLLLVVGGVATGMIALGVVIYGIGAAVGAAVAIGTVFAGVLGFILTPIGLLTVGIGTLIALAVDWDKTFQHIGDTFTTTFKGIGDAVRSGEMELAFSILSEGLKAIWFRMLFDMLQGFDDFLEKNKLKIIALGAAFGGIVGFIRGGPWGAAAGIAAGGAAAWGAGELAKGMAKSSGFEDIAKNAEMNLRGLLTVAAGAARRREEEQHRAALTLGAEATKGGFGSNLALQQFGYGDKASQLLDVNQEMLNEMRLAPDKIADKLADKLKLK